jgi:hypothetical protein
MMPAPAIVDVSGGRFNTAFFPEPREEVIRLKAIFPEIPQMKIARFHGPKSRNLVIKKSMRP